VDKKEKTDFRTVKMNFPSNSHKKRTETTETKEVRKVIKGTVVKRKKPLSKRFLDIFIGEDANNVGSYLLYDVLIPAAKATIQDILHGGTDMIFGGGYRPTQTRRDDRGPFVNYRGFSSQRDERREFSHRSRARHNFDDIILNSRIEAEEVISHLVDLTIDYGQATVADLYQLVGIDEDFTDRKYGWLNLRKASWVRTRDGYLLNLPKPILLD
jgi:hypothetical protein